MIDHIVWAVPDLASGAALFTELTGVTPSPGGKHVALGTHNVLVGLDGGAYFEIIAADPDSTVATKWMSTGEITSPQITRWALKSDQIAEHAQIIQEHDADMGEIKTGGRQMSNGDQLSWQLTMPAAEPLVEVVPFLLDWSQSSHHPSEVLEAHCELEELRLVHPDPSKVQEVLRALNCDIKVSRGSQPSIELALKTPKGQVIIK